MRERMVTARTRLICQMRGFYLEHGVAMRQGVGALKLDLAAAMADESNDLTSTIRRLLGELRDDLLQFETRIAAASRGIKAVAAKNEMARRLTSIPGIGPLGATAIVAAIGKGHQFAKARDLAVWIGLVRRQHSLGGCNTLLGISKRGNSYICKLLIRGARSCLMHLNRSRDCLGAWLDGLHARTHPNKVVVALAAKMARVAWVVLNKPGAFYERRDPAFA